MAESKLVGLVFEAWNDLDRVIANLQAEEMICQIDGGSSFAWTVAHMSNMLDSLVNVRFNQKPRHPLIEQRDFGLGGSGAAEDWPSIRDAVQEIRESASIYLKRKTESDLDLVIPYNGSLPVPMLHEHGISLRYALLRIVAHDYFHIGEIACKRDRLGHQVGNFPGTLSQCV